jgi:mannuronan 5-epimerase
MQHWDTNRFTPAGLARLLPRLTGAAWPAAWWALAAGMALALCAPRADAALSEWKASSNRIVITGGGDITLSQIRSGTPNLPESALQRVDAAARIWLLAADIDIESADARLMLTSGDVRELRLKSDPLSVTEPDFRDYVAITADPGQIRIEGVKVISWDTTVGGVDTNIADGRAFVRARSSQDASGNPRVSRMDVINSEVAYLGHNASESYGLSWKANGDLSVLDVFGNVIGSTLHHNYFAVYTFGLQGDGTSSGVWRGNTVHDNIGYGFDAHDDSDQLVIEDNDVRDNGLHGIILSERCDGAQIRNNVTNGNGKDPVKKGNGIMLHDLSDHAVIEGNTASGNADAGIAIFCSADNVVRNNTVTGNLLSGVRLSVASARNTVENNTIQDNGEYGIYLFDGADTKGVCGADLVPRDNTFRGNTVKGSTLASVKISEGTGTTFSGNTFEGPLFARNSEFTETHTVAFTGNTFGTGAVVNLDGDPAFPLRADFSDQERVTVDLKTGATARFTDDAGAIFDLERDLMVTVEGSQSRLEIQAGDVASPAEVITRPLRATTGGFTAHLAPTLWETDGELRKAWIASADDAGGTLDYEVGELKAKVAYDVSRGDTVIGSFVADSDGWIKFSDAPGTTATLTYTVSRSASQPRDTS